MPARLAGAECTIPDSAERREGVIAALVTLMVPVVMMGHLQRKADTNQHMSATVVEHMSVTAVEN